MRMRPTRLELAGFTAFREPTEIDFADADLFALTGSTGAGKTSVLDGITFGLYGSVARLDDRRQVAPVISQGRTDARVLFEFTVDGVAYTVARKVVRTASGGATTKEARLERGDVVLAGDAKAVSAEVERLLGLSFEQFTKCVVLPQGQFQRFLHDKPAERQDLLVRLLDLGVYTRVGQLAHLRASDAETEQRLVSDRLAELADATEERRDALAERSAALEALRGAITGREPALEALRETVRAAQQRVVEATAAADALAALRVPDGVAVLGAALAAAADALARAAAAATAATDLVTTAEQERATLGDPAPLRALVAAYDERADAAARVAAAEGAARDAADAEAAARVRVQAGEERLAAARAAHDELRHANAAVALRPALRVGELCPVCEQHVAVLPPPGASADLDAAAAGVREAEAEQRAAQRGLEDALGARSGADEALRGIRARCADLDERLAGADAQEALRDVLTAVAVADERVERARRDAHDVAAALRTAQDTRARLEDGASAGWRAYDEARDRHAALAAPSPDRSDLAGSWSALVAWAGDAAQAQRDRAAAAEAERAAATQQGQAIAAEVRAALADAGVALAAGQDPTDACVAALTRAQLEHERVQADLGKAAALRARSRTLAERTAVARDLAGHLRASNFEQWLLDEAFQLLVERASATLQALSSGQYSLAFAEGRSFEVVDHGNADERRSVRTLSGGETFLASLALALALAEQAASLSVHGTARLESLFLDEGFGTLDPETLDTVAAAIEELGASGRTVGVITHVRDLAERLPVRFEVRKGPATSTVYKVVL
jgi:exonuclease SbcC